MPSPRQLPIVVIACQVLQDSLGRLLAEQQGRNGHQADQVTFMDYGLHRVPSKMTWALQEAIDNVREPSLILLGYGLCGNGLKGLKSGRHTLLAPRTDDCIALLLGSYRAYMHEFATAPGTYYLSKGWLESGSHPLIEFEEYRAKYGEKEAFWLMDTQYQHYKRLMLVAHHQADLERYRPQAQRVARFCERWGMRYEERLGSDGYVRRLVEAAVTLAAGGDLPPEARADLVVVPPGDEIRQEQFIR